MNKELLRQYAEAGVRNRLKDIQKELDELYKEFPTLVANANGSIPTVAPVELKSGRMGRVGNGRPPLGGQTAKIVAYLTKHPGATTDQLATAIGITPTTYFRGKLKTIAHGVLGHKGQGSHLLWHLKGNTPPLNGNGARPHPQLTKNGKPRKRATNLEPQMIVDLLKAKPGLTVMEIARELNRSPMSGSLTTMIRKLARPKQAGKFKVWTLKA